jgi:serine/threonine protein kinase
MGWLHHRPTPIIHFDLKPANILVMNDYTCKIADFGLSIISETKASTASRGTMLYMPPETLRRKWYYKAGKNQEAEAVPLVPPEQLPKIDVYAFGLIMWEICNQTEVFLEYNEIDEFCSAICDKDARPAITPKIPPSLVDIMTKCWTKSAQSRPGFRELVPQVETARIKTFLEEKSEVTFWQSYFPTKPRVPFTDFVKALWRHSAKINKKQERSCGFESSLVKLVCGSEAVDTYKAEVSLESYRKLIDWFGPINREHSYFEDFCNIMQMKWFFPEITSGVVAEGLMGKSTKGTFLVRLTVRPNERKETPFTITFMDENGIINQRVSRKPSGYVFSLQDKEEKSETLTGLINQLMSNFPKLFAQAYEPSTTPGVRYTNSGNA